MAVDQNGETITRDIKREGDGWGVTVWWGSGSSQYGDPATNIRRYIYRTRTQARFGSISDDIGKRGRIA